MSLLKIVAASWNAYSIQNVTAEYAAFRGCFACNKVLHGI